ncbi:MAG: hypothetical protein ANABAC_1445 [Anaerolineae bacterium]|nr:MAG: hypothetical protein ANABAC_1445 [Anaerolineae bacterium]
MAACSPAVVGQNSEHLLTAVSGWFAWNHPHIRAIALLEKL